MKTNLSKAFTKPQVLASTFVACALVVLLFACKPKTDTSTETQKSDAAVPAAPATPVLATTAPAAATPAPPAAAPAAPVASDATQPAAPVGLVRYDAQPAGSKAKMEGTSTIHDWSMESAVIGGVMEADAKFPESALSDPAAAKPKVEVFIPVRSFKSYAKKMDEVMQEHMEETKFKRIEYKLIELKPKSASGSTGALQFDATGVFTIHGTARTNTMPVTIEKKDGKIKVTGTSPLKMSDFGVKPPNPTILGVSAIKTGDEIKVTFEWMTAPKTP